MNCSYCGGVLTDDRARRRACTQWWVAVADRLEDVTRGTYDRIEYVGHGGMGAVFKGFHRDLEQVHAIKVLAPDTEALHLGTPAWLYPDTRMVERFRTEAKVGHGLEHPNIVKVWEIPRAQHLHYFTMRYIAGLTLAQVLTGPDAPKGMGVAQALLVLRDIGDALDYAHQQVPRVIHRDVKPSNIMLDASGKAFVTDFGIASVHTGGTFTKVIIGSPAYMAPEAWRMEEPTAKSDQYSFGVLAYELLTGHPPFSGTWEEMEAAHRAGKPAPIQSIRGEVPAAVDQAILRMLEKRPDARWETLADALDAMGANALGGDRPIRQQLGRLVGGNAAPAAPTDLKLVIEPDGSLELAPGQHAALSAVMIKKTGNQTAPTDPGYVGWWSSDDEIAQVDDRGRVTAIKPGLATIHARVLGVAAQKDLLVKDHQGVGLTISGAPASMVAGQTAPLRITITGMGADPSTVMIRWTSSDPSIASVTEAGIVTAVRSGSCTVTASASTAGATGRVRIVVAGATAASAGTAPDIDLDRPVVRPVVRPVPARVAIAPWPKRLQVGGEVQGRAEVVDETGALTEGRLQWSSSSPDVAQVDDNGLIELRSAGQADITVQSGGLTDSRALTVSEPARRLPWLPLTLGSATVALILGAVWFFWPAPAPIIGPGPDAPPVEPRNDPVAVAVGARPAASLVITQATLNVRIGESARIPLDRATDSLGLDARAQVVWTSRSPAVVTVDGGGTVRGSQLGRTLVIARLGGVADTVTIVVAQSVAVAPSAAVVPSRGPQPASPPPPPPPPAPLPPPPTAPAVSFNVADSLSKLESLTDPDTIDGVSARKAIELYVFRLKARLSTPKQRAYGAFYVAKAFDNNEQPDDACRELRWAEADAQAAGVAALLAYIPIVCK